MTKSVADKTPISATLRRHIDPPGMWVSILLCSAMLHASAFLILRSLDFDSFKPKRLSRSIPIEIVQLPKRQTRTTRIIARQQPQTPRRLASKPVVVKPQATTPQPPPAVQPQLVKPVIPETQQRDTIAFRNPSITKKTPTPKIQPSIKPKIEQKTSPKSQPIKNIAEQQRQQPIAQQQRQQQEEEQRIAQQQRQQQEEQQRIVQQQRQQQEEQQRIAQQQRQQQEEQQRIAQQQRQQQEEQQRIAQQQRQQQEEQQRIAQQQRQQQEEQRIAQQQRQQQEEQQRIAQQQRQQQEEQRIAQQQRQQQEEQRIAQQQRQQQEEQQRIAQQQRQQQEEQQRIASGGEKLPPPPNVNRTSPASGTKIKPGEQISLGEGKTLPGVGEILTVTSDVPSKEEQDQALKVTLNGTYARPIDNKKKSLRSLDRELITQPIKCPVWLFIDDNGNISEPEPNSRGIQVIPKGITEPQRVLCQKYAEEYFKDAKFEPAIDKDGKKPPISQLLVDITIQPNIGANTQSP